MLKLISSYPISRRLVIAFALAAILPSVMIAIMGTYYLNQLTDRRTASSVIASAQDNTKDWSDSLHHIYTQTKITESQVLSVLLSPNSIDRNTLRSNVGQTADQTSQQANQLTQLLNVYLTQYDPTQSQNMAAVMNVLSTSAPDDNTPSTDTSLLNTVTTTSWPHYHTAQTNEMELLLQILTNPGRYNVSTAVAKISADARSLDSTYDNVNKDWNQHSSYVSSISKHVNGVDTNETQPVIMSTAGAFLLTLLVVIIAGVLVHRSISVPLNELVLLTRRISKGDRHARANIDSNDEISIVATAMNSMLDNIVHLIQDTQAQRDVLQGQVEKLVSEVSGVGDGDLRINAEVTADALGVLADSFNYMVEELGSLVVRVKKVAHEVVQSTNLTTDRMGELVQSSDRQIQDIANAAMEIEHMAINSQKMVDRALALANSARDARISAQGGRQAVQQTIEGMGRIFSNVQATSSKVQTLGERSREINNIVEAISNIAHQTNRLALDAAIQAAMAGDNGKGFGAVAADIRRLAERAKELATEVGHIVRSVRDDIGAVAIAMNDTERETSAGSKLAEEAGTSLESIVSVIERQASEIESINQVAERQQQSSSEVVQMMQGVSETTQHSTNSTRDAAQNMERVALLAEQLFVSVEAFKLRDNQNYLVPDNVPFGSSPGSLTSPPGNLFRTVSSTAQPASSGNAYTQMPGQEGYFPQFPQFAASAQGTGTGSSPQPPQGPNGKKITFPPAGSGPSTQPPQGFMGDQLPFPLTPFGTGTGPSTQPAQGFMGDQLPFTPPDNGYVTQMSSGPAPFSLPGTGYATPLSQGHASGPVPFPPVGNDQPWRGPEEQQPTFPPQSNRPRGTQPRPQSNDWQNGNWNPPNRP